MVLCFYMKVGNFQLALLGNFQLVLTPPTEVITEARIFAISLLVLAGNLSLSPVSQIFGCSSAKHG